MAHLQKITLQGYKSIRSLQEFPLNSGLNVLIGANGSGKTNFISFFSLLGYLMNGSLQSYVAKSGADALLFRGVEATPKMRAHLYFGLNEYKLELEAANDRTLFFAQESAPFDGPHFGRSDYDQGVGHRESKIATARSHEYAALKVTRDTLRSWRVYHFHDTSPDAAVMGRCNTADTQLLHSDAGNLAAILKNLGTEDPDALFRIEETVRMVAPFFAKFDLPDLPNEQTQLMWRDRHAQETLYSPYQLSDGTIRYICLATLLLQPEPPAMLIVDEPELGLHPHAIDVLASMLTEAAERTQLLVSTQSSRLLDHFSPAQVIVANHHDGETLLERLDAEQLAGWLEDYSLGELWEHERLGGTR